MGAGAGPRNAVWRRPARPRRTPTREPSRCRVNRGERPGQVDQRTTPAPLAGVGPGRVVFIQVVEAIMRFGVATYSLAPASLSNSTTLACWVVVAHFRAVMPSLSWAFTSAPCAINARVTPACPYRAAQNRATNPESVLAFTSAP